MKIDGDTGVKCEAVVPLIHSIHGVWCQMKMSDRFWYLGKQQDFDF